MRMLPFLAAAALLAAPAAAQKLGARTSTPDQVLGQEAAADPMAEVERIAAEAAAHPLGSVENPVRVGGPEGARAYIGRLRCADGSRPKVGTHGAGGIGPYGSFTEVFRLDCGFALPGRYSLAFDLYHEEHRENLPVPGFVLDAH
jgi:hypothetical protein